MNPTIMNRVVANLERLAKTTGDYAESINDPEMKIEAAFYATLANRLQNVGSTAGDIIPGVEQSEEFETYVGGGGYVLAYNPENGGRGTRVVQQLTLRGELVKEFPSTDAAAAAIGCTPGSIAQAAAGRKSMASGFAWRYKRA